MFEDKSVKGGTLKHSACVVLWASGLLVVAAGQGGCGILFYIPDYDPGLSGTLEFRDAETGETIDGDVLMVEYRSRSQPVDVAIIAGPLSIGYEPVSADVSRVRTGTYLWRWGRVAPRRPAGLPGLLGLGYTRRFYRWSAYFWKDGYLPAACRTHSGIDAESGPHGGRIVLDMFPDSGPKAQLSTLSQDGGHILTDLVPLIPKSNSARWELLRTMGTHFTRVLDERRYDSSYLWTLQDLRTKDLPRIRKLLAEQPKGVEDGT